MDKERDVDQVYAEKQDELSETLMSNEKQKKSGSSDAVFETTEKEHVNS